MKIQLLALLGATLVVPWATRAEPAPLAPLPEETTKQTYYVELPKIPLEASASVATEIAHVRILSARAEFPTRGVARTVYTAQMLWALKGSTQSTIEFAVGGARDATRWVDVVGAPTFTMGEELVLFLWTSPEGGETGVLGLKRGTYRVRRDADGRRLVGGDHAANVELSAFIDQVSEAWLRALTKANAQEGR